MAENEGYQRFLEAGLAFTKLTRTRAEELVQELVSNGDLHRKDAQAKVEEAIERSRKSSEALVKVVRDEVAHQLHSMGIDSVEGLAKQVASLLGRSSPAASDGPEPEPEADKPAAPEAGKPDEPETSV